MRLFRILAVVTGLMALAAPVSAQTTAAPVVPGSTTVTGCPSVNLTPCFVPSSSFDTVVPVTPVVANASHVYTSATSTVALGSLQTVAAFRYAGQPSGIVDYVQVLSKSGATTGLTIYGWTKSPASTCNDNATFVLNTADPLIPGFPISLTPAAMVGASATAASQSIVASVKNADTTATTNLYFCAVVNGTFTPAANDFVFSYAIAQD